MDMPSVLEVAEKVKDLVERDDQDQTNLLQSKIKVEVNLESESDDERLFSQQETVETGDDSEYVPGTPGAAWSKDEMLAVKAKLWYVMSLTRVETADLYKSLHPRGFDEGPLYYRGLYVNRMPAQWLRLGFHGCFPDAAGGGGCDGCLYFDDLGHIYLDYFYQNVVPHTGKGSPNFNNGLTAAIELLEAIYKNGSWPPKTPQLPKSLFESGKSRADLWSFAAINAAEFGAYLNNMVCDYPDFEYDPPLAWPDSLENGGYAQHCTQTAGTPQCKVNLGKGFKFQTGRKDCIPFALYDKVKEPTCPIDLEITTKAECNTAATSLGLEVAHVSFHDEGNAVVCKFDELKRGDHESLCFKSLDQLYNDGKRTFYVDPPMLDPAAPIRACRVDLRIISKAECEEAAKYLFLKFDGEYTGTTGKKGCFMTEHMGWKGDWGALHMIVHWAAGDEPLKTEKEFWALIPGKKSRAVCRMVNEKVGPYMASSWGGGPSNQMDGDQTVEFFKKEFKFTPRETVAIMGAHTMGRFHGTVDIFRYIWVRNGGMLFNNAYFRNMAGKRDYRFMDPNCVKQGDAFGNAPIARWTVSQRGETDTKGPISWVLERHICKISCRDPKNFEHACCKDIPEGGHCKPDNGRANGSDPLTADDDINNGCEVFETEPGAHESALPSEMGLYYKFTADADGIPSGCPGFADVAVQTGQGLPKLPAGCPKNDKSLGESTDMKMFELVEKYAEDNDYWIRDFIHAFEKCLRNGYEDGELVDGPRHYESVVCPTQEAVKDPALMFWSCFTVGDFSEHLSPPFMLVSYLDMHILELNETTGQLQIGPKSPKELKNYQKWYFATTEHGKTLVNGVYKWGVGNYKYDESTHFLDGGHGLLMRKPYAGEQAKLIFQKDRDVSWISAGWAKIGLDDRAKIPPIPSCLAFESSHGKYVTVGWDGGLNANSAHLEASSRFKVRLNDDWNVWIQCAGGKYVSADAVGKVKCNKDKVDDEALFVPHVNLDGTISLKTAHDKFIAASPAGAVSADRNYQKFTKTFNSDGTISLKGAWGKYSVGEWDGWVKADRWWPGAWERFHVHTNNDGTISLKTVWGKWAKAEPDGTLDAHEDVIGPEHKFEEIENGDGSFSYKTYKDNLLVASGNGKMYSDRKWAIAYEHFRPLACN